MDAALPAQQKLARLLRYLFQFDAADLDFGLYRILRLRRSELDTFLERELLPQARTDLADLSRTRQLESEISALEAGLSAAGMVDFASVPRWRELTDELHRAQDTSEVASEVFSLLTTFFSRYYEEGDFLALPRYKFGVYCIPYDGAEVTLHWANSDQYYIKTTESFATYDADVPPTAASPAVRLTFRVASAESDRDNIKSQDKRAFALRAEDPFEVDEHARRVTCWFEWRAVEKGVRQADLNARAAEAILAAVPRAWALSLSAPHAEKRTRLDFQLERYTQKNTSDYFIHKDLRGFLRRELDFFIKNEVVFLDEIDDRATMQVMSVLHKAKALRRVAQKIIDWLAQIEDFQKRLYLKKKFVLRTEWVKVGARPEGSQWNQVRLGTTEQLALGAVSGAWRGATFKGEVAVTGLLVNGDNFQAIRLLGRTYRNQMGAIYIDPPYNSPASEIIYKNNYKHSSWMSLMSDRLRAASQMLGSRSVLMVAIDENEQERLGLLLEKLFPHSTRTAVSIVHNPRGIQGGDFSYSHEYVYFVLPPGGGVIEPADVDQDEWEFQPLRKWGGESLRSDARNCFYPIYVQAGEVVGWGSVPSDDFHPATREVARPDGSVEIWPVDKGGVERKWRYAADSLASVRHGLRVTENAAGTDIELARVKVARKTVWVDKRYDASTHGKNLLTKMGVTGFDFPKSVHAVSDCLAICAPLKERPVVMDFFAGSGTTGHAVLNLNRIDNGDRRFVLVEMGEHFDNVLVPRIMKATWSKDWKDGAPVDGDSVESTYKLVYLESYDDTLENLEAVRTAEVQRQLFDVEAGPRDAKEAYVLKYMLDVETRGSLLKLDHFKKPWDYKIKVRKNGGAVVDSPVDLVETFNYLLGLDVRRYDDLGVDGLWCVYGTTRSFDGETERVLVLWRDCDKIDNVRLGEIARRAFESFRPNEFDVVYVNGDHHLENIKTAEERWRVMPTEETFHTLMFDTSDET